MLQTRALKHPPDSTLGPGTNRLIYLSSHLALASRDIDELRDELGRRFTPHSLNITRANRKINSYVCSCAVNDLRLLSFSYGKGVPVQAATDDGQCSEVISLNFQTSGTGHLEQQRESHAITANQGLVINMDRPFRLDLQGYSGVALVLSHETLRRHARSLLGERAGQIQWKLDKSVDLTKPAGQALKSAVLYAVHEMDGALGALNNPISLANLENYLLTQFITLHPNTLHHGMVETGPNPAVIPRYIKRARDYIHAHAHEKITLAALAAYAGCSYRSLQSVFGKVLGMPPMAYLKMVRLEGLRNELLTADSAQRSVAEIAGQWGFVHMGRLAQMYKKQFGVLPSETLSQSKSRR